MHIVPQPERWHPAWCAQKRGEEWPVHDRQIGVLELPAGVAYAVVLQHVEDPDAAGRSTTTLLLIEHTNEAASSTRFTLLEAGILRNLLTEALQLVG